MMSYIVIHLVCCIFFIFGYFLFFFFFKQKTAYEMRISDWSSDVCSSDLPAADIARREPAAFLGAHGHDRDVAPQLDSGIYQPGNGGKPGDDTGSAIKVAAPGDGIHVRSDDHHVLLGVRSGKRDRKSVVWGKSVSERVDFGGRAIITKKIEQRHYI